MAGMLERGNTRLKEGSIVLRKAKLNFGDKDTV
jgi:hypothetical protein